VGCSCPTNLGECSEVCSTPHAVVVAAEANKQIKELLQKAGVAVKEDSFYLGAGCLPSSELTLRLRWWSHSAAVSTGFNRSWSLM